MVQQHLWAQKLTEWCNFWTQKLTKVTISRPRNNKNGSAIFLDPETDKMVQFLAPETDIMGGRIYIKQVNTRITLGYVQVCRGTLRTNVSKIK